MSLEARITSESTYTPEGETRLTFELTNTGTEDVCVLTWHTPLEGLFSDCLRVTRDGVRVSYDGILVKRGSPTPEDYLIIPAGSTRSRDFDLNSAYKVSVPGTYNVEVHSQIADSFTRSAHPNVADRIGLAKLTPSPQPLHGPAIQFKVEGAGTPELTSGEKARRASQAKKTALSSIPEDAQPGAPMPPSFEGGTDAQRDTTKKAHSDGYNLAAAALSGLANDARYLEWFGVYSADRFQTVQDTYRKVKSGLETKSLTYNLTGSGCNPSWYAYTHKGDSTVWMCTGYWNAPANGTDSKAGTVVHEWSHALADTDDIQYGQTACRDLAKNKPNDAVRNADTFEFYAGG